MDLRDEDDLVGGAVVGRASSALPYWSNGKRWVMIPSVFTRPPRSAAMAAPKEVISAKEPLIVISRRNTSNGWNVTTSSLRVTP